MTYKQIATGVHVEIEPDPYTKRSADTASSYEKAADILRRWAKEIEEFFHDHRSQDANGLSVVIEYKWVCQFCEDDFDSKPVVPTCCDEARQEYEDQQPPRRYWSRHYSDERGDKI